MAYAPPTTFTAGTTLTSANLQGNTRALRVYLHRGIIGTDLQSSTPWIRTGHIQPPILEPWQGIQHGVGGHVGGQWAGGEGVRLTFLTSALSGGGLIGATGWHEVPGTAFTIQLRRAAKVLFHWWAEVEHGPDDVPYTAGRNYDITDRLAYIAPYVGNLSGVMEESSQPGVNHQQGWNLAPNPPGAVFPYPAAAGYGQRDGVVALSQPIGSLTIGLCSYSQIDRCAVVNWGIALETFYL